MENQKTQKQKSDDLPAFVEAYFSHLSFAPHVPKEFHEFLKGHLNAFALVMRAKYRPCHVVAESAVEDIQAFEKKYASSNPGSIRLVHIQTIDQDLLQSLKDMIPLAAEYAGTLEQTTVARENWLKAKKLIDLAEMAVLS